MKSGNIVLIGPTNSGKSTLVNSIMGRRVTLVSRKKQSTTFNQKLTKNISEFESILQDTPGTFASMKKISNKVISSPFAEIDNAVIIYLVLDISKKTKTEFKRIQSSLKDKIIDQKIFLVLNKIDKCNDEDVLKSINFYSKESLIQEIFPVSSINGDGVSRLLERSNKYLKIKESKYQSKDKVQIKKELFYSEVTREKILDKVHKEIPYQCDVITDKVENRKNEIKIFQTIEVRRKSHKSIVIGKRGSLLKEIGSSSRKEIAKHENKKIHLFLFIKVVSEKKL